MLYKCVNKLPISGKDDMANMAYNGKTGTRGPVPASAGEMRKEIKRIQMITRLRGTVVLKTVSFW